MEREAYAVSGGKRSCHKSSLTTLSSCMCYGKQHEKMQLCILTENEEETAEIPDEILNALIPLVWASKKLGQAKNAVLTNYSPSSGKVQPPGEKHNLVGPSCLKDLRTAQSCLVIYWLKSWKNGKVRILILPRYSMRIIYC